jgi:transcriptional regulator with XRE-family HTH domain
MDLFAKRPRERAQLGLTDAEVARRAGLNERRYGHYVRGNREPRFGTFDAASSIVMLFIRLTSIIKPPSSEDQPSRLWRPLRARRAVPSWRAHATALTTSCATLQNTIASGYREYRRFQPILAAS